MNISLSQSSKITPFARAGLIAKGFVYSLLGIFVFMAAFRIGGQSPGETDKKGVFSFIQDQTGGQILLGTIALGLACYSLWRAIQAIADTNKKGNDAKGLAVRGRYLFSGLVYGSFTVLVVKMLFSSVNSSGSNSNQTMAQELLSKPFGQWMAGIVAIFIIGVGIYQGWYGLSEKYQKHVNKSVNSSYKKLLLGAGKIGYVARGVVWILIGWMFAKAAFHAKAEKAGDTSDALGFLSEASYGSYLLGSVGFGLLCYGLFNFIRARYEQFGN